MKNYDYYIFMRNEEGVVTYLTLPKSRDINKFCTKLSLHFGVPYIEVYDPNDWNDIECFYIFLEKTYGLLCKL